MGKLQGKVALIAGAASGIGCASAIRFAAEGAGVVVAALNSQGGEGVVSEIAANGGRAVYQRTDVTSEQEIKSLMERAVREYGPPRYHLQQRWPKRRGGPIESVSEADWDKTFEVLIKAVFFGIQHSAAPMRASAVARSYRPLRWLASRAASIPFTLTARLKPR
jgi:NAD(P)-dependent dehydrogenase (short-subunit alcohol dehydrogenase family)